MNIEITNERPLNDKEKAFVEQIAFSAMKEANNNFEVYNRVKQSITSSYQIFVDLKGPRHAEDIMSNLILSLQRGTRAPVRGVLINETIVGLQVFAPLHNPSLIKDAVAHIHDNFYKQGFDE